MTSGTPSVIMAPAHHQNQQQLLLTPSTSVSEEHSSSSDDSHVTNATAQESSSCTTSPVAHQTPSRTQLSDSDNPKGTLDLSSPLLTSGRMSHPRSNHRASPDSRRTPSPLPPTSSAHKTTKTVISVGNATNVLVKVRAQVMTRDDSTGLWKTVSGGGPSDVVLLKRSLDQPSIKASPNTSPSSSLSHTGHSNRPPVPLPRTSIHQSQGCTSRESLSLVEKKSPHLSTSSDGNEINKNQSNKPSSCLRYEYVIVGTRISDKNVVLYCTIKRDFVYNRATPSFHHWVSGNNKFGLTFSTANSATSFHKVVTEAFRDIVINEGSLSNPPLHENEDEDIFMPLQLPLHQGSSSCSPRSGLSSIHQRNPSTASTASSSSKRGSATSASSNESFKKTHSNIQSKDVSKASETRKAPTTYDRSPPFLPRMMPKTIPPEMEDYRETAMDTNKSSSSSQRQRMNSMVKPISGDLKIEEVIERINASGFSRHQVHPSNDYSYPLVNQKFSKSSSSPSVMGARDFPSPTSNQSSKFRVNEFSNLGITESSPTKDWRSNGTKSGTLRTTGADPPLPTKRIRRAGFFSRLFQRNNNNNHHYKCNKRSMSRSTSLSAVPKVNGDKQDTCSYRQCRYCLEYYSPNGLPPVGVSTISQSVERKMGDQNCNQLRESRRRLNVTRKTQAEFQQQQRQRMDCEYAPDRLLSCINYMTCICCASGLLYHCIEKDEDDSGGPSAFDITHSSSASSDSASSGIISRRASEGPTTDGHAQSDETRKMFRKSNRKRCILWTLLCIFVPCLWCYPCLKGCHSSVKERSCIFSLEPCSCCVDFCVGGKHEPLSSPESSSS